MLMNTKHIRKIKVKVQKTTECMAQGKQQAKFERIHALGIEIIATQTDGRTNFDVMSSADIVKQS